MAACYRRPLRCASRVSAGALIMSTLAASGCVSVPGDQYCALDNAEIETLVANGLRYLADVRPGLDLACQELSGPVFFVREFGCVVYGGPSNRNGCPGVLDGEYRLVFDRDTLMPTRIVDIAY